MPSFGAWLDSPIVHITIRHQHDQYYATADRFGVAGVGTTEAEALRDVAGLVEAYLRSYFNEGRAYGDAVRAPQTSLSARLMPGLVFTLLSEILGRIFERRMQLVLPGALRPR
jgi:hypothetical protein